MGCATWNLLLTLHAGNRSCHSNMRSQLIFSSFGYFLRVKNKLAICRIRPLKECSKEVDIRGIYFFVSGKPNISKSLHNSCEVSMTWRYPNPRSIHAINARTQSRKGKMKLSHVMKSFCLVEHLQSVRYKSSIRFPLESSAWLFPFCVYPRCFPCLSCRHMCSHTLAEKMANLGIQL